MNDRIQEIFSEQESFQKLFYDAKVLTNKEKVALSKEYILSAHRELGEVLNLLPWKTHRKTSDWEPELDMLSEEIVDVVKFVMNLLVIWGVSADDFYTAFNSKSKKVRERYEQEHKKSEI